MFDYIIALLGYSLTVFIIARLLLAAYNIVYPFFISSGPADFVSFSGGKWAGALSFW